MLLMKFIQNKEVLMLLYESMKELHKTQEVVTESFNIKQYKQDFYDKFNQ